MNYLGLSRVCALGSSKVDISAQGGSSGSRWDRSCTRPCESGSVRVGPWVSRDETIRARFELDRGAHRMYFQIAGGWDMHLQHGTHAWIGLVGEGMRDTHGCR